MKKLFRNSFAMTLLLSAMGTGLVGSEKAIASDAGPGTINGIHIMESGVVLFHQNGSRSALPACGSGTAARWAFDGATPAGQAKLSLLLTAYSTQKPIAIHGTGTCTAWGDTETILYILTAD